MTEFLPPAFLELIILFIVTETLLSISPGPAVLLTISHSMKHGFGAGIWGVAGILTANLFYFILSALGVGALIIASATLFAIVKYIGAAYLVYMGVTLLLPLLKGAKLNADEADGQRVDKVKMSSKSAFYRGFIIQTSNPKNLVFFVALLPQFVSPALAAEISLSMQFLILAVVSGILEFCVLFAYILLSLKLTKWVKAKAMLWIDGAAGVFLIIIGVGLASIKKFGNAS